jgi:nitroreductase
MNETSAAHSEARRPGGPQPDEPGSPEEIARFAIGAAVWAPSVHNTQPWRFGAQQGEISLYADPDRRLAVADPDGREMLISCGAALFTVRLALRYRGYVPEAEVLPDPDRPMLVARIRWARRVPPADYECALYRQVPSRRTHRGGFEDAELPERLLAALGQDAARHRAVLRIMADGGRRAAVSAVVDAAESLLRLDLARSQELARWASAPGSRRPDGVPASAYQAQPEGTSPSFLGRDYAQGRGWGTEPAGAAAISRQAGAVGLLTTARDEPADWVNAGQALQRLLLDAASCGAAAALHTQPLELPQLRDLVRTHLVGGSYPQMIMRLGLTGLTGVSVRRPVEEVLI